MTRNIASFPQNLRTLRKQNNMTQAEFADKLGFSEKTVSKWECGSSMPNMECLFLIADMFAVSVERLFSDTQIYLLGIDGGASKTVIMLADLQGNPLRQVQTKPCNPIDIGISHSIDILTAGIREVCRGIPLSSIYCFAGISGGSSAYMQEHLSAFFRDLGFRGFRNGSDSKNIIAAGLGSQDGIAVILGTGICAFAQKNGTHKQFSGRGYFIDNGGSGFNIGKDGLHAYFCALDGLGKPTCLTEDIALLYPDGPSQVMDHIYSEGKSAIAAFAPLILAAAGKGDPIADAIIDRNMRYAAHIIETAAKEFPEGPVPVILAGGLIKNPLITAYLTRALQNSPRLDIRILEQAPVHGAIQLAKQMTTQEI